MWSTTTSGQGAAGVRGPLLESGHRATGGRLAPRLHPSLARELRLGGWAEARGFADLWHAEIADPDALVTLAAIAGATSRVRLGTAILPLATRSVPVLAAAAATMCELAPGRFALGVGVSSEVIIERWNGATRGKPLKRARESIELLRLLLAGERSVFAGAEVQSAGFKLRRPPTTPPDLMLAALNERMLQLAGEVADGVFLNFVPVSAVRHVVNSIARGAERAGRATLPEIAIMLPCTVSNDRAAAREPFARALAFYLSAPPYQRALTWYGLGHHVERAREAWKSQDIEHVRANIADTLVDALGAFGPLEYCREMVEEYWDAGVNAVGVSPIEHDYMHTLDAFSSFGR
jgi:probable F420-dependent oxidoreductase